MFVLDGWELNENVERGVNEAELVGRFDQLHQADMRFGVEEELVDLLHTHGSALVCDRQARVRTQIDIDLVENV